MLKVIKCPEKGFRVEGLEFIEGKNLYKFEEVGGLNVGKFMVQITHYKNTGETYFNFAANDWQYTSMFHPTAEGEFKVTFEGFEPQPIVTLQPNSTLKLEAYGYHIYDRIGVLRGELGNYKGKSGLQRCGDFYEPYEMPKKSRGKYIVGNMGKGRKDLILVSKHPLDRVQTTRIQKEDTYFNQKSKMWCKPELVKKGWEYVREVYMLGLRGKLFYVKGIPHFDIDNLHGGDVLLSHSWRGILEYGKNPDGSGVRAYSLYMSGGRGIRRETGVFSIEILKDSVDWVEPYSI